MSLHIIGCLRDIYKLTLINDYLSNNDWWKIIHHKGHRIGPWPQLCFSTNALVARPSIFLIVIVIIEKKQSLKERQWRSRAYTKPRRGYGICAQIRHQYHKIWWNSFHIWNITCPFIAIAITFCTLVVGWGLSLGLSLD